MKGYQSRAGSRMQIVWARLTVEDRRILCHFAQMVPGAAAVPFENFRAMEVQQLAHGMRSLCALARECEYALSYTHRPAAPSK